MEIRRYKPGEEQALWELFYNTVHKVNCKDYTKKQVDAWAPEHTDMSAWIKRLHLKQPFVAVINNQLVGFAELETNGHIDCFYCAHDYQRQGIGTALLARIENEAKLLGLEYLFTEASLTALEFFKKRGFKLGERREVELHGEILVNYSMSKILYPYRCLLSLTTAGRVHGFSPRD